MEHTTLSPPICAKHGCEKVWRKASDYKAGARWCCLECGREKTATYYARHPGAAAKSCKTWRANNPDLTNQDVDKERGRKWKKDNPGKVSACNQRRRARKLNATSPLVVVTAAIEAERKALTDGCAFCGADEKLTLEHVVALKDGGLHVPSNLVGACLSCNSSKHVRPVYEWYSKQPFFSEQRWQRIQTITGNGQLSLI